MELEVAETIARATREEAERQAQDDLDQLRRRAVEAGRERSRTIFKVTLINATTGAISYNPAGRLLRDWYLHVYINSLRANASQPSEVIDFQQVEETTAILMRIRAVEPLQALKAVDVAAKSAVTDADVAAARITEHLHEAAAARAIRHTSDERFDGDLLRVHLSRHWYLRCYENTVDEAVKARHPLAPVTNAEILQVARTLATHEARRMIGRDGIPLVAAPRTAINQLHQALAADHVGLAPKSRDALSQANLVGALTQRVSQAWSEMDHRMRADLLTSADMPHLAARLEWSDLNGAQQAKLVQLYLVTHRQELLDAEIDQPPIEGTSVDAARIMFDHSTSLRTLLTGSGQGPDLAQLDLKERKLADAECDVSLHLEQGSVIRRGR
jgi:hypothetical protein